MVFFKLLTLNEWESRFWNHIKNVQTYDVRNSKNNPDDNNQYDS